MVGESAANLHGTLQAQPMIFHSSFGAAVIAVNKSFRILKLRRHRLSFNTALEVPKLHLHVNNAPATYRTAI